jgi:ATP-dependent protease ClpP protease subunit
MWNGNNESLHQYSPRNFMHENSVYLQDEITEENCAYLIGDIHKFVMSEENVGKEINFVINTPGGSVYVMNEISSLIAMAKLRNIKVVTWVLGFAASAGSIIAVQGDERWMSRNAIHMIHFGSMIEFFTKETELAKAFKFNKEFSKRMDQIYLENCKNLTVEKLQKLEEDEMGKLFAEDCKKLGICDYIIEDSLKIKKDTDKQNEEILQQVLKIRKQKGCK